MAWSSGREAITPQELKDLGIDYDARGCLITASANRRSVVIDGGHPTGFIKRKDGWYVVLYDPYMAGHFQRRPNSEAVPYEEWKSWR